MSIPTTKQLARFDTALERIAAEPERHNQGIWMAVRNTEAFDQAVVYGENADGWCGTACCLAGRVVLDDGAVPVFPEGDEGEPQPGDEIVICRTADGIERDIEVYARELLGLDRYSADVIFDPRNTLDDLRGLRDRYARDTIVS